MRIQGLIATFLALGCHCASASLITIEPGSEQFNRSISYGDPFALEIVNLTASGSLTNTAANAHGGSTTTTTTIANDLASATFPQTRY